MSYKLKGGQEAFTIVDGPDAGRTFKRGVSYPERPRGYARMFTKVKTTTPATGNDASTAQTDTTTGKEE